MGAVGAAAGILPPQPIPFPRADQPCVPCGPAVAFPGMRPMRALHIPTRRPRRGVALAVAVGLCMTAAQTAHAQTAQIAPTGSFLAERIDASALPVTDRVTDEDGTEYLVEFDRLILSLRADRTFRASVRFRRTLWSRNAPSRSRGVPLQSLTVSGTYTIVRDTIHFVPDNSEENRGLRMLAGRVESSRRISVPFDYRNGAVERRRVLALTRRDDIL